MKLMDDPSVRERVAQDLRYEVHALWSTALEYASRPHDGMGSDVTINNALLESCLVHARLIADFLDVRTAKHEDVLAVHFLPSWNSQFTLTKSERDRINWMIMHLSAERVRVSSGMDLVETAERVLQVMGRFVGEISDPVTEGWFEPLLREQVNFARRRQELESDGTLLRNYSATSNTEATVSRGGNRRN